MRHRQARRLRAACVMALLIHAVPHGPARAEEKTETQGGEKAGKEEVDTEHIFGFSEGSDIGQKGEREIENITIGSFGKIGSYNQVDTETSLRYSVTDRLRLSIGTLTDAYAIRDVPGLDDRQAITFSGLIGEARYNIVDNRTNPYGLSVSFNPSSHQFDPLSGERFTSYTLPVSLLFDKAFLDEKLFVGVNVIYAPTLQPAFFGPPINDVSFLAAATYAVTPKAFLGAEIRHENLVQGGVSEHALFVGPSLFYAVTSRFNVKVAWAIQIPDAGARSLDLSGFQRHQVELQFAYGF